MPLPCVIGNYTLEKLIGQGKEGEVRTTVGRVYQAVDNRNNKRVAFKVFRIPSHRRVRFEFDVRFLINTVKHENLVRVLDGFALSPCSVKEFDDSYDMQAVIVMELAKCDLRHYFKVLNDPSDLKANLTILKGILNGVRCLFSIGMLHGDLKPTNIVLNESNVPMLTDYGFFDERACMVVGRSAYSAPEARRSFVNPYDISCGVDMYSMGVLFIELLTKKKVFNEWLHGGSAAKFPTDTYLKCRNHSFDQTVVHMMKEYPAMRMTTVELSDSLDYWIACIDMDMK